MDYEQFIIALKEKIALLLSPGMELQIHTNLKNNGAKYKVINPLIKGKTVNVVMEELFRKL